MRPLPKFARLMLKKRSSKLVLGAAALAIALGSFAACAAKDDGSDTSNADYLNPGQSGYDSLPYRHGSLLMPR